MTALVNKGDETTAVESTEGRRLNSRPLHRTVDESLLAESDAPKATVSCFMKVLLLLFGFPDRSLCSPRGRGLLLLF